MQDQIEDLAHKILALSAAHPRQFGRLRTARIVSGQYGNYIGPIDYNAFAVTDCEIPIIDIINLIDALVEGGLLTRNTGITPRISITSVGERALKAHTISKAQTKQ